MKIKGWIVAVMVVCLLAGCNQSSVQETKVEAGMRWQHTQAEMLCSVAGEHLKAGQLEKAQQKAIEALSLDPNFLDARVLLAKTYIEQGRYASAVGELNQVCTQRPSASEPVYLLAVAHEKDGKLAEALAEYRKAFALDNNNVAALAATAEVLVAMGNPRDAQAALGAYIGTACDDPAICELAGRISTMLKDYPRALKYYQQAHDLDFKNRLYVECIAKTQFMLGQYADAAETLRDLLEKDRNAPWIHRMLGECYMCTNKPASARDEFQLVTDQSPADASAWIALGKAALACGDPQRAILSCDQALKLDPSNLDAMLVQGYSLILSRDNEQALRVLGNAAIAHPASVTVKCLLGKARAANGDDSGAAKCFADALALEPGNKMARGLLSMTQEKVSDR